MKELFTLYYHRRILFTDFFSQSRRESQWNFIKFSVNQAFLSYFDFHLIDPSQACDVDTSKYWILQDMGHGSKSLRCLNE